MLAIGKQLSTITDNQSVTHNVNKLKSHNIGGSNFSTVSTPKSKLPIKHERVIDLYNALLVFQFNNISFLPR